MITKIENGRIRVDCFGLLSGNYQISDLTIHELVRERNLLHVKLFEQNEMDKEEFGNTERLISQLTELIVEKCGENKL